MLDVDKQDEWEHPLHGVFAPSFTPKPVDNIARFLRKPKTKGNQNETLRNQQPLQQSA